MTMFAKIEGLEEKKTSGLHVFVNEELVGKATPLTIEEETYYFLTIQSDNSGAELRFQTEDGTPLQVINPTFGSEAAAQSVIYCPDVHLGSLKAPIRLLICGNSRQYKIIENDHVVIIRNNEKYSITGNKLQ